MVRKLLICRHGHRNDYATPEEKIANTLGHDEPISPLGHRQAEELAAAILSEIPAGASVHIVSSPFVRCIQTVAKVASKLALPIHLELGFGEIFQVCRWDYNPFDFLQIRLDPDRFRYTYEGVELRETEHLSVPSYPESANSNFERVNVLLDLYLRHRSEDIVIISTHQGPLRSLVTIMGGDGASLGDEYATLTIGVEHEGNYRLEEAGRTRHLSPEHLKPT